MSVAACDAASPCPADFLVVRHPLPAGRRTILQYRTRFQSEKSFRFCSKQLHSLKMTKLHPVEQPPTSTPNAETTGYLPHNRLYIRQNLCKAEPTKAH